MLAGDVAGEHAGGNARRNGSASLGTVVFNLGTISFVHTPEVTAIDWRASPRANGAKNVYRGGASWIKYGVPHYYSSYTQGESVSFDGSQATGADNWHNAPMMRISGAGHFFVVHFEDSFPMGASYRHVLVTGAGPTRFYHLNTEHAVADANTEVRDATDVQIFGMKCEGYYPALWIRNSSNVLLSGYGGNACPFANTSAYPKPGFAAYPPSLFRVEESVNVSLANLIAYDMAGTLPLGDDGGLLDDHARYQGVPCLAPNEWVMVFETLGGVNSTSRYLDRPVLWQRGV